MFVSVSGYGIRPNAFHNRLLIAVLLQVLVACAVLGFTATRSAVYARAHQDFVPLDFENNLYTSGDAFANPGAAAAAVSNAAPLTDGFALPAELFSKARSQNARKTVRIAQANFDFTGFQSGRVRMRPSKPARRKRVGRQKTHRVKKRNHQKAQPLFGFFGSKPTPKVRVAPPVGGTGYHIAYRRDGRAYRVYPGGKKPGSNQWGFSAPPKQSLTSGYRTMCVRTCDGFYFPVSNSTKRSRLRRDNNSCQASCGVPAKLFYYRNSSGSVDTMVDLNGRKYSSQKFAYKYRKKAVNNCRCKPQPWDRSEIIRHEQYAMNEQDRGVKRVKLVKVAEVDVASASIGSDDNFFITSERKSGDLLKQNRPANKARVGRVARRKIASSDRADENLHLGEGHATGSQGVNKIRLIQSASLAKVIAPERLMDKAPVKNNDGEKAVEKAAEKTVEKTINKPVKKVAKKKVKKAVKKVVERSALVAVAKPIETPVLKVVENPVYKPVETAADKTIAKNLITESSTVDDFEFGDLRADKPVDRVANVGKTSDGVGNVTDTDTNDKLKVTDGTDGSGATLAGTAMGLGAGGIVRAASETSNGGRIRNVKNSRKKMRRMKARKRYRGGGQKMKDWWRSNRY